MGGQQSWTTTMASGTSTARSVERGGFLLASLADQCEERGFVVMQDAADLRPIVGCRKKRHEANLLPKSLTGQESPVALAG